MQSEDTVEINSSDDKIADNEQDVRKMTTSKTLDSLDAMRCFAKTHGDKQMDVMLNEVQNSIQRIRPFSEHFFQEP